MAVRVRRIEPGEGPLLRDVRLAALADAPDAFSSRFEDEAHRRAEEWEADATARSAGSDSANFVAESERGVVGLVGAYRSSDEPGTVELVSMWVAPRARGTGAGAALVGHVVDWARVNGARRVALWVMRENVPAIALYRRTGFATNDVLETLATHPCHDEVRMARELGS
jgi:GNAT superfamily N-acetyltransferase